MLPGSVKSAAAGARDGVMTVTVGTVGAAARWSAALWRRRGTAPTAMRPIRTTSAITTTRDDGRFMTVSLLDARRARPEQAVDDGNDEERGERRHREPADDRAAQRRVLLAALAEPEGHGEHADDHRERGHQHRTEPRVPRGQRGAERGVAGRAPRVGERDAQDAVRRRHRDA